MCGCARWRQGWPASAPGFRPRSSFGSSLSPAATRHVDVAATSSALAAPNRPVEFSGYVQAGSENIGIAPQLPHPPPAVAPTPVGGRLIFPSEAPPRAPWHAALPASPSPLRDSPLLGPAGIHSPFGSWHTEIPGRHSLWRLASSSQIATRHGSGVLWTFRVAWSQRSYSYPGPGTLL